MSKETMIELAVENYGTMNAASEKTLLDVLDENDYQSKYPVVVANVNNKIVDLFYKPSKDSEVEFFDMGTRAGTQAYYRSLIFLLYRAVKSLYPEDTLIVDHSISKGLYCHFKNQHILTDEQVKSIEQRMHEIVEQDEPFVRHTYPVQKAIRLFREIGEMDKVRLLENIPRRRVNVYSFGPFFNYFFGPLVPRAGYLKYFRLTNYPPGFVLLYPHYSVPMEIPELEDQPKLFSIFQEHEKWGSILEVEDVGQLNQIIVQGDISEFIKIAEALHGKKIDDVAEKINEEKDNRKIILIAGPSSSGKTTFSKRLYIQLRVFGLKPVALSLDDYFKNRSDSPRDENGNYDFECLDAIDVELFNEHLLRLLDGQAIEIPRFDFTSGERKYGGRRLKLGDAGLVIIEGIHGLNDALTPSIPPDLKQKIYVSALTHLNIDNHNRIPTTDTRLLRRIVRDARFRSHTAQETISRWHSVREGEERFIFPFQEQANFMFNSALVYELSILKRYAETLLRQIPRSEKEYSEARRLLKFLSYFRGISQREVPPTSILREFIGGSSFMY